MTAAECLALLSEYRTRSECRQCECLDWALAQLQQVGDYALACQAAELRPAPERQHPSPNCASCPPIDAVIHWLRPNGANSATGRV